jgi:hypothetical protein
MRPTHLLPLACLSTLLGLGCDDGSSSQLTNGSHQRSSTGAGTAQDHDNEPTVGEHAVDPGNPNASASPNAPTTAGTSNPQFALSLGSSTPTLGLGDSTEIDVTVQGNGGFNGPVSVTVSGLPQGVTAAPLQVTPGTPGKLTLQAELTATVTAPSQVEALVITGTSGALTATANANFKVAPKLTLTIPTNIDALRAAGTIYRDEWGAPFGQNQQALQTQTGNGIVVTVFNADSKAHIIHGANGFAHGDTNNPIQPNAFELNGGSPRTRTLGPGTNAMGYPHDGANGAGAAFRIQVNATN